MARKPPKGKSLADLYPDVAKQWHPIKNGDLSPFDFSYGSNLEVWWKCNKGDDHEWEVSIKRRSRGEGCPICIGKKVVKSNCLSTTHPELAKEWHTTKNGSLTPDCVSGGHTKFWWKCNKGDDHEWQSSIVNRKAGKSCPICVGQKIVDSNCLANTHPEICKEWHPFKNSISPQKVGKGSRKKVWWKCDKGDDHEWEATISSRVQGRGCPICTNRKVVNSNCLANTHPEISKFWHPTKNGDFTPLDVVVGSGRVAWWKCDKGDDHEWQSTIAEKQIVNCPVCAGRIVVKSNCLSTTHPKLAKEWHPTKNGDLSPKQITSGSGTKVWWKCNKGDDHIWESSVAARRKVNCPICANQKVVASNSLFTTNPEIALLWHPTKNGIINTDQIVAGSNKSFWWKCDKSDDHEWKTSVYHLTHGTSCPFCTLTPQSKQELTITFELIQFFKDINPRGFKTRVNGKIRSVDIYIPQLSLGIEFDGNYWHKGKRDLDKLKTKQLKKEGFDIIRVRETPLKKINRTDVISKQPFNGKEVANKVLKQIMKMYDLDAKKVRKIENYLDKKELQNEKGLDKYIDMILTEKAEKNN